jgi:hypothetical protein
MSQLNHYTYIVIYCMYIFYNNKAVLLCCTASGQLKPPLVYQCCFPTYCFFLSSCFLIFFFSFSLSKSLTNRLARRPLRKGPLVGYGRGPFQQDFWYSCSRAFQLTLSFFLFLRVELFFPSFVSESEKPTWSLFHKRSASCFSFFVWINLAVHRSRARLSFSI